VTERQRNVANNTRYH